MADQLYDPAALSSIGSRDNVGGPRGYKGAEVAARHPWKCPSCGEENVSRELGQGCEFCHAGEGSARHVGVDPIVRPKPKGERALLSTGQSGQSGQAGPADLQQAFLNWMQQAGTEIGPFAAFRAGWLAAQERGVPNGDPSTRAGALGGDLLGADRPAPGPAGGGDSPGAGADDGGTVPSDPAPDAGLTGTPRSRTLLAALIFFRDQVLAQGPEEVVTGEWMPIVEVNRWIAELKGSIDE